ncbi:MAG: glycosyltransferase family protein [Planctomycetota bacterium]|jgi:predicted glycosyltransferase
MKTKSRKMKETQALLEAGNPRKLRIALFTHDTFGLGHVKRCLHITRALAKRLPDASILLITGCPALNALKDLPQNADCIKIPTVVKTGARDCRPPHLPLSVPETTLLRSRIIKETVLAFAPDVFVVDNFPLGSQGELLPLLQALKHSATRTVLGLRDVLDAPDVVQGDWKRQGVYEVLDRYYDKILVYGLREVFDVARQYALDGLAAKKIRYCGYLTDTSPFDNPPARLRSQLGVNGSFVLATGGGGGDAYPLLSRFLRAAVMLEGVSSVVFTGPLMGKSDREKLRKQLRENSPVILRDFVPDLRPYLKAAEVVVTMCGYNMAAEILAYRPRAIVVPRTWKYGEHTAWNRTKPEKEQIIRAQMLEKFGFVNVIEPQELSAEYLAEKISVLLRSRRRRRSAKDVDVGGVDQAVKEIMAAALS